MTEGGASPGLEDRVIFLLPVALHTVSMYMAQFCYGVIKNVVYLSFS